MEMGQDQGLDMGVTENGMALGDGDVTGEVVK